MCACVYVYFCIFISERAVAVHPLATRGCTVDAENAFFLNDEVVAGIFPFSSIFFFFFLLVNICFITTAVCDDPHFPSLKY